MSPTELQLLALYRAPVIRLDCISKQYFNLSPAEAARSAALNDLPVPAFRLRESTRAPLMVRVQELAQYIDSLAEAAAESHERSKL